MGVYRSSMHPRAALHPRLRGEEDRIHELRGKISRWEVSGGLNADSHNAPQRLGRCQTTCSIGMLSIRRCDHHVLLS